jgi:calcium binding protein 39
MKPNKIVSKAIDALTAFASHPPLAENKREELLAVINKNFSRMTDILYKKKEGDDASSRALQLVSEIGHDDFVAKGLDALPLFPVEQRKQFTIIFTGAIAHQVNGEFPVAIWVQRNTRALDALLGFYNYPDLAVCAGEMLRLCVRHAALAKLLLAPERLDRLFSHFTVAHFDVSADSFATFRELILKAPQAEDWLRENTQQVIDRLHATLVETNYAACRQSLKLIGEILCQFTGNFQEVYLTDEKNLIIMMKLMVSTYKNISMEAYHIFKLFVARSDRPETITKILRTNSKKLIEFIHGLLDASEDEELQKEKEFLLVELGMLTSQDQ